jgi:ABC-type cobalamin/Fe3+-siderophores transport system ATPase subunit
MLHADGLGAHVPGPPARWLFRALELTIAPGEIWALVGPNGSGKSTLLRCLAGLRPLDEGGVLLHERPLAALPGRERAKQLAYLPQFTPLYHDLRVRQVVMLGRAPHLSRWRGPGLEDERHVDRALARVDAVELAERPISTLSGGERQRVMLARLLATGAALLLLDEPTTALDVGHALRLLALCRDLAADGAGVVLAMHELELARRYADRAVCLGAGPAGEHHMGAAAEVLTPAILGAVFDVDVQERGGELSFHPRG